MIIALATAAIVLTPVSLQDPLLAQDGTFVSDHASTAVAEGRVQELHCLDLPQHHPEGERVCLTAGEWQAAFDLAAHEDSTRARERAIGLAHWYMGGSR